MPDLLILSTNDKELANISKIAKTYDFRIKVTTELSVACSWVKTRHFDLVVAADEYGDKSIESLSSPLWGSGSKAQFVVYTFKDLDPIEMSRKRWSFGLQGIDFASGQDVYGQIESAIRKYAERRLRYGSSFKIMVVEDLDSPRDIICAYIEHLNYGFVKGFGSAKDALAVLKHDPSAYSCVITDISMPEMNGWEFCEAIRKDEKLKHLPVIALTAYGTADSLMKCLKAGASGFLIKPPSKSSLGRELSRAEIIIYNQRDPRLIKTDDMDLVEELLQEKGYI